MTGVPRHRAEVRPRWGRIAASVLAVAVVVTALLGAVGLLHDRGETALDPSARIAAGSTRDSVAPSPESDSAGTPAPSAAPSGPSSTDSTTPDPSTDASSDASPDATPTIDHDKSLPADSGSGRRAVFSESRQRVWIVGDDGTVERTYLVSGSLDDNLDPGTYSVYSRSEDAVGVDDSGTMKWFVRFAHGPNAAIGFHDIPVKAGEPLQTLKQLGTPQSHGCIRQKESDALAMWAFAQIGTKVVVTA